MNSNGQILTEVNTILDGIRGRKCRIADLKSGLCAIDGNTQDKSTFSLGRDLVVELSNYSNISYMHKIKNNYKTAMVFVRRGISEEIEMHENEIKRLEDKLSKINLVYLSK